MSLFSGDKDEKMKQDIQLGLAQIGGLAAGGMAGAAATIPVDARHQKKLVAEGLALTQQKEEALQHWKILLDLQRGRMSLEDLPENVRGFYEQQLAENADELKTMARYPQVAKDSFQDLSSGRVVPLFQDSPASKMRGFFPQKVHAPASKILPGAMGLAGFMGAGKAYREWHDLPDRKEGEL